MNAELNEIRQAFEGWMASKGKTDLKWLGKRYDHPRLQSLWVSFLMGWKMKENQK
jgi:hypothetical protein